MRAAIVEDGQVINVIVVDENGYPGAIPCSDEVGIGWTYDGTDFIAPPLPEPEEPVQ